MKKIAALLFCIVLICAFAAPAFAASTTITITASKTTLQRGDEFTITFNFAAGEAVKTAGFKLAAGDIDRDVFEIVSGSTNLKADTFDVNNPLNMVAYQNASGKEGFALIYKNADKHSAQMGTITLRVKDDAKIGTTTITCTPSFKNGAASVSASSNTITLNITCDHSWGAWSNGGDNGHTHSCSKCGTSETVAHTWDAGKQTKAPTCAEEGVKTFTCTAANCGATKTEAVAKLTTHTWGSWAKENDTKHKHTCTVANCGASESEDHKWDAGKQTKAPTCAEEGVKTFTCTVEGCKAEKTEAIAKLTTHSYGAWTKENDTKHKHTCTVANCGASESEDHKWDEGKETKAPTCKEPGVKTYTCKTTGCGATKTEELPKTDKHTFGNLSPVQGTNKHKDTCSVCNKEIEEEHTWSAGTVTKAATCKEDGVKTFVCVDKCGAEKTEAISKDTVAHSYGKWENLDDKQHKHTCTVCTTASETADHTWNAGTVTKTPTCKEEGVRTFTCTGCGAEKTEKIDKLTEHAWGKWQNADAANHKRTCTVCGDSVSETKAHGFATKWTTDKNQHWYACADCDAKKDAANHTPGAAATETKAQRCTVCNYIIKAALGHTHKWATKLSTDATGHWYACSGCNEKKDFKAHDFANDCDGLCETCQFTRATEHKFGTEWTSDETGHYHACTVCGEKADVADHAPGVEATETTAQTCTACGFELVPALGHTHVFSETWEKDDVNHWHVCACGETSDVTAHEWNDQGLCPTCLAEKPVEEAPAKESFPWWIIILVAVVAVGGAVAAVVLKKKKQ